MTTMAAVLGVLELNCPVCARPLRIPIGCSTRPRLVDADTIALGVDMDRAYIRAHELTHGHHDGEPYSLLFDVA